MSPTPTDPRAVAIRAAESRLQDYLARSGPAWFVTTNAGLDREDRRPILMVYAAPSGIADAAAWVEARGGEWEGFRLRATIQQEW